MNKTLTLEIDEQLLHRAHRRAVDENKSVPAWVAELVRRTLDEADEYERNRRQAMQRLATGFHLGGQALSREDLHDRD
jgi:hypothetical protein